MLIITCYIYWGEWRRVCVHGNYIFCKILAAHLSSTRLSIWRRVGAFCQIAAKQNATLSAVLGIFLPPVKSNCASIKTKKLNFTHITRFTAQWKRLRTPSFKKSWRTNDASKRGNWGSSHRFVHISVFYPIL